MSKDRREVDEMLSWSLSKLKFTLGIGTLCSAVLVSELSQKLLPMWLVVGIVVLPFAVFIFADPDDVPHSIARMLQAGASLWYLAVNSVSVVLFLVGGNLKPEWPFLLIGLAVGCIPCVIVLGRVVVPNEPTCEVEPPAVPGGDYGIDSAWNKTTGAIDVSKPVVYYPKKSKLLLLLLASAAFVVIGVLAVRSGQAFGWLALVFFGACGIVCAMQFLPNCSHLRVSAKGIEIRSLWRTHRYEWSDISCFYVGSIGTNKMVMFDLSPSYRRLKAARAISKAITGAEIALPDNYGMAAETLAEHLHQWKTLLSQGGSDQIG
jgi:hypothetical protein